MGGGLPQISESLLFWCDFSSCFAQPLVRSKPGNQNGRGCLSLQPGCVFRGSEEHKMELLSDTIPPRPVIFFFLRRSRLGMKTYLGAANTYFLNRRFFEADVSTPHLCPSPFLVPPAQGVFRSPCLASGQAGARWGSRASRPPC